jgi:methyl-accepting chemotaxis protein
MQGIRVLAAARFGGDDHTMRAISVKATVIACALGLGGLALGAGGAGLFGVDQVGQRLTYVGTNTVPSLNTLAGILSDVQAMQVLLGRHVLAPTEDATLALDRELDQQIAAVEGKLEAYRPLLSDDHERGLFDDVLKKLGAWKETLPALRKESIVIHTEAATELFNGAQRTTAAELIAAIEADYGYNVELAEHELAAGTASADELRLLTMAFFGLAVVGAGAAIFILRGRVLAPLASITTSMQGLASGDLDLEVPYKQRTDEVGAMAASVEVFRHNAAERARLESEAAEQRRAAEEERQRNDNTRRMLEEEQRIVVEALANGLESLAEGDLRKSLDQRFAERYESLRENYNETMRKLRDAMRLIGDNSGAMRLGTGEISEASTNLAKRTEQQAASLEETAAALDEITTTVNKSAEGARLAHQRVDSARVEAEASRRVVQEAISAMGQIEASARQIVQIIGVIDEISFQTNLLALNAGVEAARAGEVGRGFAVVASEVRALAQRSAEAAKQIKQLISTSSRQVEAGVKLVDATGTALVKIVDQVAEISTLVGDISASASEQALALAQINTSINQMDQTTQQNAAMVEENSAASQSLAQQADELAALVGKFKVEAAGASVTELPRARHPERQPQVAPRRQAAALRTNGATALAVASAEPAEDWAEF